MAIRTMSIRLIDIIDFKETGPPRSSKTQKSSALTDGDIFAEVEILGRG
jgi:hypothetical protein